MAYSFYTSRKGTTIFIWLFSILCLIGIGVSMFFLISSFKNVREVGFEIDATTIQTDFDFKENFDEDSLKGIKCYVLMSNGTKVQIKYDASGNNGFKYDNSNYKKDVPGTYEIYIYYKDYIKQTYTVTVKSGVFQDMVFNSAIYTYEEGVNRTLALSPSSMTILNALNVTPVYTNNVHEDAGTYESTVTIAKENYNTMVLTSTLQINKANYDLSAISLISNDVATALVQDETAVDADSRLKTLYSASKTFDNKELEVKVKDRTGATLEEGSPVNTGAKANKNKLYVHYENNINLDSGEYEIVASFKGDDEIYANNYNPVPDVVCNLNINPFETAVTWASNEDHDFTYNTESHDGFVTASFVDVFGLFGEKNQTVYLEKHYINLTTEDENSEFIDAGQYSIEAVFGENQQSPNYIFTNKFYKVDETLGLIVKKAEYSNVAPLEYVPVYTNPLIDGGAFPSLSGTYGEFADDISEVGTITITDDCEKLVYGTNGTNAYDWTFVPLDEVNYKRAYGEISLNCLMDIYDFNANSGTLNGFKNASVYGLTSNYTTNIKIPDYIDGFKVSSLADDFVNDGIKINILSLPNSIPTLSYDFMVKKCCFKNLYVPATASISVVTGNQTNVDNILLNKVVPAYVKDGCMTELQAGQYSVKFYNDLNQEVPNPYNSTYAKFVWSTQWIDGVYDGNNTFIDADTYALTNKSIEVSPARKSEEVEEVTYYYAEISKRATQSFIINVTDKTTGEKTKMPMNGVALSTDFNRYTITDSGTKVRWFTDSINSEDSNFEYEIFLSEYDNIKADSALKLAGNTVLSSRISSGANSQLSENLLLTRLVAPGLKTIGDYSFYRYTAFKSIEAKNVTTIGSHAFISNTQLNSAVFDKLTVINQYAFNDDYNLKTFEAKGLSDAIYEYAFYRCTKLESLDIPQVKRISDYAFYGCTKLANVYAPSVTNLGRNAFYNCNAMTSANFSKLESVPVSAFQNCNSLNVAITDEKDGEGNFVDTSFPRVKSVSYDSFASSGINKISSSILNNFLSNSSNSTYDLYYSGSSYYRTYYTNTAFNNCNNLTSVKLTNSAITTVYGNEFANCTNLEDVEFPYVKIIYDSAFSGCTSLKTLKIPVAEEIYNKAFNNCSALVGEEVSYEGDTITKLNLSNAKKLTCYAFQNCTSLRNVQVGNNLDIFDYSYATDPITNEKASAFVGCTNLVRYGTKNEDFIVNANIYTISNNAITGVDTIEIGEEYTIDGQTYVIEDRGDINDISDKYLVEEGTLKKITNLEPLTTSSVVSLGERNYFIVDNTFYMFDDSNSIKRVTFSSNQLKFVRTTYEFNAEDSVILKVETTYDDSENVVASTPEVPNPVKTPIVTLNASSKYFVIDGVLFKVNGSKISLYSFPNGKAKNEANGDEYAYYIPSFVSEVGTGAFAKTLIKSIDMNAAATYTVQNYAFGGATNLIKADFNKVGVVNTSAFYGCNGLTDIKLPSTATINGYGFANCSNLTSVLMTAIISLADTAFTGCPKLVNFNTGNVIVNMNEKYTGTYENGVMYEFKTFKTIYYYNSMEDYESYMKGENNSLRIIYNFDSDDDPQSLIPYRLFKIPTGFNGDYVAPTLYEKTINKISISPIYIEVAITEVAETAAYECTKLTSVTMPSVVTVEKKAFYNCTALTRLDMTSVKTISDQAFYSCGNLVETNVVNVQTIGDSAFYQCTKLQGVKIDATTYSLELNKLTSLGSRAFYNNQALKTIKFDLLTNEVSTRAFESCTNLTSITIPEVKTINSYAFNNCSKLSTLDISSATTLGSYSFYACTSLPSDLVLNNVTSLGNYSFNGCTSLESVDFKAPNFSGFSNYAFAGCSKLVKYKLNSMETGTLASNLYYVKDGILYKGSNAVSLYRVPVGLSKYGSTQNMFKTYGSTTKILDGAFDYCTAIKDIVATNVEEVQQAFSYSAIETFTGDNVTSISSYLFNYCSTIKEITMKVLATVPDKAFCYSSSSGSNAYVYINNNRCNVYYYSGLSSLTSVTLSNATSIGAYAFCNATNLTQVICSQKITSVGSYAFYNCSKLKKIGAVTSSDGIIMPKITKVDSYAFYRCNGLTNVELKGITKYTDIGTNAFSNSTNANLRITLAKALSTYASDIINRSFLGSSVTVDKLSFK